MLKAFKLLNQDQKKTLLLLVFLILGLSLFEILTFYLLQPVISFFSGSQQQFIGVFANLLPNNLYTNIKFLLILFVAVFVIRCCLTLIIGLYRSKLCKNINDYLSNSMYRNYLYQDYSFFLENNSSKLISNIIIEVEKFSYRVVDAMLIILTELFIGVAILSFLFFNYFNASFALASVIGIIFILFNKFYKSKFKKLGEIKTYHDSEKINDLQKSFYVIQNIKLDSLENFFSKKFKKNNKAASDSYFLLQFFAEIPKPLIELSVLLVIFIIMYFAYYYLSFSKSDILIMIGIYGVAMFRLLPSCNRILNCTNQVRYYFSTIEMVSNEIQKKEKKQIENDKKSAVVFSFKNSIDFQDVVFSYPNSEKKILDKINFKIKKNEMLGISGISGSGKSTFLNLLTCLLKPSSGFISVDKKPIEEIYSSFQKKISYVPQKIYLTDESLINNVIFGQDTDDYNYQSFWECIEQSNLTELVESLPEKENTIIGERGSRFSGGQQQRLGIARALYKKPEIVIFDEATSGLDKTSEEEILKSLNNLKNKTTAIIVSHNSRLLSYCERVVKIQNGKFI